MYMSYSFLQVKNPINVPGTVAHGNSPDPTSLQGTFGSTLAKNLLAVICANVRSADPITCHCI